MKKGIRIMQCSHTIREVAVIKVKDFEKEAKLMMQAINDLKLASKKNLRQDFYYVEVVSGSSRIFYVSFTGDKIDGPNPEPYTSLILQAEEKLL